MKGEIMKKNFYFVFFILILASFSCTFYTGIVKPNVSAKNEIVMTDELKALFQENPRPKVVIRVPNPPTNVTEAEKFNAYINTIEKVFIQSGYTVRDRALLETLLKTGTTDYKTIGEKIDTDIIIDILSLQFDIPNRVYNFFNKTTNKEERFLNDENFIDCKMAKLECRLTIVNKGQLGGVFTFYTSRCDVEDLDFILNPSRTLLGWIANKTGPKFKNLYAGMESEELKQYYTQVLAYSLINQLSSYLRERINKAAEFYNQHQYPQALEILEDLIRKDPKNYKYYTFTGMIYARQKDFQRAQQELDRALMYASTPYAKADVYYTYSNFYALKNEKDLALSFLKKALDAGFKDFEHIRNDEDLMSIRDTVEFKTLLSQYETPGKKENKK